MKFLLILSLVLLASCGSVQRYVISKKGDSPIDKDKIDTIYIGRLSGDSSGEFKAILTKRLISEGFKIGELPNRNDGISTYFNEIENPKIDISKSAIISGRVIIERNTERCTSDNRITCLSTVGIANIIVKHAKDNSVLLSESFRTGLNNRQALVDTQNQRIYNIEYDTRRVLAIDVTRRLLGHGEDLPYPVVMKSNNKNINDLGQLIVDGSTSEATTLFEYLFAKRENLSEEEHDELILNGSLLHYLNNQRDEAVKISRLSKTKKFRSELGFLNWSR